MVKAPFFSLPILVLDSAYLNTPDSDLKPFSSQNACTVKTKRLFSYFVLATIDCSLFPRTFRDLNDFPDSYISSAKMSNDCVSNFASLPLMKNCQLRVSRVNYSDSEMNSIPHKNFSVFTYLLENYF